jgi:hypothetical protein
MHKDYSRTEARSYLDEGSWIARGAIWKVLGLVVMLTVIGFAVRLVFLPAALVERATDPDHIISNYEEFQNIYNTCQKMDADLKTIRATPDGDPMFTQFSKGAMVAAKRQQMTRWVNEYNAKSKMLNRQYWKSTSLPYQLNEEDFPNYNGGVK